jgi:hypothetical protein
MFESVDQFIESRRIYQALFDQERLEGLDPQRGIGWNSLMPVLVSLMPVLVSLTLRLQIGLRDRGNGSSGSVSNQNVSRWRAVSFLGTSGWPYRHWYGPALSRGPAGLWRANTPRGFCFAAKGSRFLNHMKKLKDPDVAIGRFFERIDQLKPKLGPTSILMTAKGAYAVENALSLKRLLSCH